MDEGLLSTGEQIRATLKCSVKVFIYGLVFRPGTLVLTTKKLIFVADSLPGLELREVYEKENIRDIQLKKGWLNPRIVLSYGDEVLQFKEILNDHAERFVEMIKEDVAPIQINKRKRFEKNEKR
ncbi:PH domain-containing protein [Rossellomorea marisflavi]|uniref:PH domain-containing protein n=1 Tax=Rossellomorea marisflavi TaxID=189381 RepID=UPI003D2EF039